MKAVRTSAVLLLLAGAMMLAGCNKKKVKTAPPAAAQPPTITEPQPSRPPTEPTQPPAQPAPETTTVAPKPAPKAKPARRASRKTKETPPAAKQPAKTVVDNGSAPEAGQISAAVPPSQVVSQRSSTAQLLDATEANLKSLTRTLSADEQSTVQQIRNYMQQSRSATAEGDTERAYHLASKAHQLSDALAKPQ